MRNLAPGAWRWISLLLLSIAATGSARVVDDYGNLPLAFEENIGQTDRRVKFLARGSGFQLFLTPTQAVYRVQNSVLRMELAGATRKPHVRGLNRLSSESHYLDRKPSITHVRHFGRVEIQNVYPGIDLTYYGNGRELEYDFIIAPGADPRSIAIDVEGADRIAIDDEGKLLITTAAGTIAWRAPAIVQSGRTVAGGYVLRSRNRIGFHVDTYDRQQPLIIDPVLAYSMSIGGSGIDSGYAVAVDGTGSAVITGETRSANFPTTVGTYTPTGADVFVTKLNPAGTAPIYSTFLGPGTGFGIALQGGNAYVTGRGTSAFPVTLGALNEGASGTNVFVTKLTSDGSGIVYSTVFGRGKSEGAAIAVDAAGNAYVTGTTTANNFTTTANAFQATLANQYSVDIDAFVVKLNPAGSTLLYSTYLGSGVVDQGEAIAVDSAGNLYVAGTTAGRSLPWNTEPQAVPAFPTTAAGYSKQFVGGAAAFVGKFNPAAATGPASAIYLTLLGGDDEADKGHGIAVDASGNAYVTGAAGVKFPVTAGAYGTSVIQAGAFVTKLNTSGSALVYSAIIAGAVGSAIALDSTNNAFIAGTVSSVPPFIPVNPLGGGIVKPLFLTKLNPAGSAVEYSTYVQGHSARVGVAVDPTGAAYVGGTAFPASGNTDAFVAKIYTNRAPIADAGPDRTVNVMNAFTLDGSASSDPDGPLASHVWTDSNNVVVDSTPTVTLTRPQGVYTFTLTVSDGLLTASDTVIATVNARLGVSLYGIPSGRITSADGKIDCTSVGPACSADYSTPTAVTLTATPATGAVFKEWQEGCTGSGPCTVTVTNNVTVTVTNNVTLKAFFDVQQLMLNVSNGGNGKVTSAAGINCGTICSVTVPYGTQVKLIATRDPGYLIDTWAGACAAAVGNECSLTMTTNQVASISFKEIALTSLSVVPASATVGVGQRQQFTAVGTFSDGSVRPLSADHSIEGTDARTCAITKNGTVKCWDWNPVNVTIDSNFEKAVMLSAGTSHVCALFANGTVNCDGTLLPGISTATAIASESAVACILLQDRTVRCWNASLGMANPGLNNVIGIGAEGGPPACAVIADGSVQCWDGWPGPGSSPPAPISRVTDAIAVTAGVAHGCALRSNGLVQCWGDNTYGQLGNGTFTSSTAAVDVQVSDAISVVAGDYFSCALFANGTVQCWGRHPVGGHLVNDLPTPNVVSGLNNVAALGAGATHACATIKDGTVKCWGFQIGGGPNTLTPFPISNLNNVVNMTWSNTNVPVARVMSAGRAAASSTGSATITASTDLLSAGATLSVVNTPAQNQPVIVKPVDSATGATPVTVTFASVSQAGSTTLTTNSNGIPPPSGYTLGDPPRYYELTTTAVVAAPIKICINYTGITFIGPPQLSHFVGNTWTIIPTVDDPVAKIACGEVTSLSPFALFARKIPATLVINKLTQIYDGLPKPVSVTTVPAGLSGVSVTYNGAAAPPTNPGSYTVTAVLTLANYEAAPVTAVLKIVGSRSLFETAISDLQSLRAMLPRDDQGGIDDAIESLGKAIAPSLWVDSIRLDAKRGGAVFDATGDAIKELVKLSKDIAGVRTQVESVIGSLLTAERILAQVAIAEASDPKRVAQAKDLLARGDQALSAKQFATASDRYAQAWGKVVKATDPGSGDNDDF